jgi:transcriptional regulator of acetoin/glycerol metabolism
MLAPGDNTLGSAETNDLVLALAGVSRRHARLRTGEEAVELEDLQSTNGTFVNGSRVEHARLRPGDVVRFGPATLTLHLVDPDDLALALVLPSAGPPRAVRAARLSDEARTPKLAVPPQHGPPPGGPAPLEWIVERLPGLRFPEGFVVGRSPASAALYREMHLLCLSELPLLLCGETGVGKELVAQALHLSSRRRDGPFLAINCAAIPADLLEAELFGIADGAASGVRGREGLFQQARAGSLLLDEIGETSPALQAKLLRALQGKQIQPVGGRPQPLDVRILAATNQDLLAQVEAGRFRRDLYYRVAGAVLTVAPLRERRGDIPALVERFLVASAAAAGKSIRGVSVKAMGVLAAYPWPGNVRQLEHEVRRLVHRCGPGQVIDSTLLDAELLRPAEAEAPAAAGRTGSLRLARHVLDLERHLITLALEQGGGSRRRAATVLGISRNALARKMKRLGISA